MSGPSLAERIAAAVERLYRRDPARYAKLVVWGRTVKKQGHRAVDVAEALEHMEQLEDRGVRPDPWWPYMMKMLDGVRRRRELAEHERRKTLEPAGAKALLRNLLDWVEKRERGDDER